MDDAHGKLSRYLEIDIGIWKRATNTRVDRSTAVSLSLSAPPATLKWKRVRCCEERVISSNRLAPCVDPRSLARSLARRFPITRFPFQPAAVARFDRRIRISRPFSPRVRRFRRKIGKNTKLSLRGSSSTLLHSPFLRPSFLATNTRETTQSHHNHVTNEGQIGSSPSLNRARGDEAVGKRGVNEASRGRHFSLPTEGVRDQPSARVREQWFEVVAGRVEARAGLRRAKCGCCNYNV